MKKISIVISAVLMLTGVQVMAQSIQEGVNHLYAQRNKSAKATFEKMLATNPNNLEATYWLGQTYIAMDDEKGSRGIYEKALMSNGNAPLLLVGMGHIELIEKKRDEARQRFETAITLSRGKKGDDPAILNAIGRANVDTGDIAYAIEKLKVAADRDLKNPDIFLNLGNAYRKAHEGGQAITAYQQALTINPAFAVASYRIAKLYETQQNWEIYLQNLNDAITKDPKFAPAYYELNYYYLLNKRDQDLAKAQEYANKFIANADADPQNDYLRIQTLYVQKKYDEVITGGKNLIAAVGAATKPRTFKVLAYSYVEKGDTAGAKQYIDEYFAKAKEEDIIAGDYILKGQIYGGLTGDDRTVIESYAKAALMEPVYEAKMKTLQEGVDYFEKKGKRVPAAEMRIVQASNRKTPNPVDLFFIGLRFYQGAAYERADSAFKLYVTATPDTLFGHFWLAKTNFALDTTMSVEPYVSTMVNSYQRTLVLAGNDKVRFRSQGVEASKILAGYYNNIKKDKDSAIVYLQKGLEIDPANASIQELIQILQRPANQPKQPIKKTTGASAPASINSKNTGATAKPVSAG